MESNSPAQRRGVLKTITAKAAKDVGRAYSRYYSLLADVFAQELLAVSPRVVLEAGCGKGQLTFPLLSMLPKHTRLIAVDSSRGPYRGWLEELAARVRGSSLARRVQVVRSDAGRLTGVKDESVDAIVSNELLCDLPRKQQLEKVLGEFQRVLRPGGRMVHGEWVSWAENGTQSFVMRHWPTWTPDQLFSLMKREGFYDFHVSYFDTTISFGYEPGLEELRSWGAPDSLLKRYDKLVRLHGLQLPFEHIITCRKAARRVGHKRVRND